MLDMIDKFMDNQVPKEKKVILNENISLTKEENNFYLESPNVKMKYSHSTTLIDYLRTGDHTPIELVCRMAQNGENPLKTLHLIEFLWGNGFIQSTS